MVHAQLAMLTTAVNTLIVQIGYQALPCFPEDASWYGAGDPAYMRTADFQSGLFPQTRTPDVEESCSIAQEKEMQLSKEKKSQVSESKKPAAGILPSHLCAGVGAIALQQPSGSSGGKLVEKFTKLLGPWHP